MVEQRNHFSNKFDDFQALIKEFKNQSLIARQRFERLEAQRVKQAKFMAEQAKVKADQAKVNVEKRKQQTQSQVKLLEATSRVMGETRQH